MNREQPLAPLDIMAAPPSGIGAPIPMMNNQADDAPC